MKNIFDNNMERFDQLKEKSIEDIVQFFRDAGLKVPEDDWFELDVPELKEEKGYEKIRYMFVTGANNRMWYDELENFSAYKMNNQKRYKEYIKERAKQRIELIK